MKQPYLKSRQGQHQSCSILNRMHSFATIFYFFSTVINFIMQVLEGYDRCVVCVSSNAGLEQALPVWNRP